MICQILSGRISPDIAAPSLRYPISRNTCRGRVAVLRDSAISPLVLSLTGYSATYRAVIVRYSIRMARKSSAILSLQAWRDMKSIAAGPLRPDSRSLASGNLALEMSLGKFAPSYWCCHKLPPGHANKNVHGNASEVFNCLLLPDLRCVHLVLFHVFFFFEEIAFQDLLRECPEVSKSSEPPVIHQDGASQHLESNFVIWCVCESAQREAVTKEIRSSIKIMMTDNSTSTAAAT